MALHWLHPYTAENSWFGGIESETWYLFHIRRFTEHTSGEVTFRVYFELEGVDSPELGRSEDLNEAKRIAYQQYTKLIADCEANPVIEWVAHPNQRERFFGRVGGYPFYDLRHDTITKKWWVRLLPIKWVKVVAHIPEYVKAKEEAQLHFYKWLKIMRNESN